MTDLESKYKNRISNIIKILGNAFGYEVCIHGNRMSLRSIYAFDEEDTVCLILNEGGSVSVEENAFIKKMEKERKIYLDQGNSLPAFLSAITLNLFNQKTFQ
ncbi:hypothetical protein NEFER03_0738 [Nematocida sp. LUAm3]|nr:hypothetical protein NEFER03_0738 [Nematocida sp. LUAm3]KAI5175197.1 hypothetical protein NEFER02_1158 [Nematocida sp. LUAm2]KAI5178131.1 hypothetical protein NEFER01_1309 [Nematocida sp. LUAm1]